MYATNIWVWASTSVKGLHYFPFFDIARSLHRHSLGVTGTTPYQKKKKKK